MLGRILVFLGGLLVLLLFAALLAPLFVDWTGFRQQFEDQASRIIGKKVVVHGSVDARILPFPSITMNDVWVGSEPDGKPQVRVARFSMDAELAPVLSGEALIFDMRIEDMEARIRLLPDGTLDWMRGSRPVIPARSIVLENVRLRNGNITFIDEQSGRTRKLTAVNAAMSAKSLAGPWKAVGDAVLDGEPGRFSISTNLTEEKDEGIYLRARVMPTNRPVGAELEGQLALVDGKPRYKGSFLAFLQQSEESQKADPARPAPRLKGSFELTNEKIRIPEYRLEVGDVADPYVVTGEATLDTGKDQEFLLLADGQQIDVARIDYSGSSGKTGRDPGDTVRKRFEHFAEIAASIPIPSVPGRASLKLPAIVIGETSIRDVRLDVRPTSGGWVVDNAIATLPGRTMLEAKGVLGLKGATSFNGHMTVASRQPSGLSTWMSGQVDPVIRDMQALGFEADVRLTPELQRFDRLELQMGDATLKGKVERQSVGGQPPSLTVVLSGNRIDLDGLRGLATLFGKDGKADLSGHAIAAELKAERFAAFGMEARQTETVFTLANSALSIERFSTKDLAGAQINAIGRADFGKDGFDANGRLGFKAADPAPFLAMIAQKLPADPLLGHLLRHAAWFADTELKVTLAAGGKDQTGLSVKLAGTSNGSRLDLDLGLANPASYPKGAGLNLQATLENPRANVLLGQAGLEPLPFDATEKGVLSLRLAETKEGDNDVQLAFNAGKTSFSLKGKANYAADPGLTGQFVTAVESDDATPYLLMTGIALPRMGLGLPGKLAANLSVGPDTIEMADLQGQVGGNALSGRFSIDRKSESLKASGALALTDADLGWIAETVYGPVFDAEGGLSADTFGDSILSGMKLSVDLSAQTFDPDFAPPIRNWKSRLTASDGELVLGDVSGEWAGGSLAGSARLGNTGGSGYLQVNINAENGVIPALTWYRGITPVADGRFALKISGEAAGKSMAELAKGLGGSGELRLNGLAINGLNLGLLPPVLAEMDKTEGEIDTARVEALARSLLTSGTAKLGDVTLPFSLGGGSLVVQPVTVNTPEAALTGEGEIDVAEGSLRSSLTVALAPGANAVEGADPQLRLDFNGPLDAPSMSVDTLALTNFLSLRAFERERHRVERLQAIALEKLRLRREAAYYQARAEERERIRKEEEARRKAEAEEAARARAEAEQKARAEAEQEADRQRQRLNRPLDTPPNLEFEGPSAPGAIGPAMPVMPGQEVIRGTDLPPPSP
ncbi:AsmA family protein [Gellertiella hungarica]|uniref:AsmA family protein n=1 Tax=Gellertiella hungarica TaxID=1572859 RepID=UPI0031B5E7C8